MSDRAIAAICRRLDKWELNHLRQHATDLSEQLARVEEDRDYYKELAEFWCEQSRNMVEEMQEAGAVIGMTKDGHLQVIEPPEAA
jgi:hypothetical protein